MNRWIERNDQRCRSAARALTNVLSGARVDVCASVPHIVALADLDSLLAKNVVGGDDVKIEMRQLPVPEVLEGVGVEHQVLDEGKQDRALLRAVEGGRGGALNVIDRPGNACFEIIQGLLIIFKARRFTA